MRNYVRTVLLNFLFLLLIPALLAPIIYAIPYSIYLYLLAYTVIESKLDTSYYSVKSVNVTSEMLLANLVFNGLLLYGVGLILELFMFNGGLMLIALWVTVFVLVTSTLEVLIDKLIMKG